MAIGVSCDKIHFAVTGITPQDLIHRADRLNKSCPVKSGRQPHTGDDIANGGTHRRLSLVLGMHHVIGRRLLRGETFVKPPQHGADLRVQIAQPLNQLHGKCGGQRSAFKSPERGDRGLCRTGTQEAIGQFVRFQPGCAAPNNPLGQSAQVLYQDHAQRNGDRPQFTDGQRLYALIGIDKTAEHVGIEPAVGVRDKGPGHPVHTRIVLQMAGRQFGQLSVIPGRQVVDNFAKLLINDVEIVHQPFGRWSNRFVFPNRASNGPVRLHEDAPVFQHPRLSNRPCLESPVTACAAAKLSAPAAQAVRSRTVRPESAPAVQGLRVLMKVLSRSHSQFRLLT